MDVPPTPSGFGELINRVGEVESDVKSLKAMMVENTAITREIKETLPTIKELHEMGIFARVGKRVVYGFAAFVVAIAGAVGSWKAIITHIQSLGK